MVSAAVESEKKDEPMNLSQVSPKAQQGWAHNYLQLSFIFNLSKIDYWLKLIQKILSFL